jgi:hypothetical protein
VTYSSLSFTTTLRIFGKKKRQQAQPWSLWIQGEKLSSNVKGNMLNSIHDPEAAKTWGL